MDNAILYMEVNLTCILFLALVSLRTRNSTALQSNKRKFLAVTISNMVLFTIDIVWIFVDSKAIRFDITMNWIVNGLYFIVSGLVGYFWFDYSEGVQQSAFSKSRKYRLLAFIPALILIVLAATSYFSHFLYYIDADNVYQRGPGYFLQLIIAYGYVLFTAIKAFVLSFHSPDYRKKIELRTLSTYVLPSLVFGALQVVFPGFPLLPIGTSLGLVYVYLCLQEQSISLDALTKLNNRNQLFQYLSIRFRHIQDSRPVYLLMIDVNKFKAINDKFGHTEGDNALRLVATSLKSTCGQKNFFVARYGGDEFTVICELDNDAAIEGVCQKISKGIEAIQAPYSISVSIGSAKLTSEVKSEQELIALADKNMYARKAASQAIEKPEK